MQPLGKNQTPEERERQIRLEKLRAKEKKRKQKQRQPAKDRKVLNALSGVLSRIKNKKSKTIKTLFSEIKTILQTDEYAEWFRTLPYCEQQDSICRYASFIGLLSTWKCKRITGALDPRVQLAIAKQMSEQRKADMKLSKDVKFCEFGTKTRKYVLQLAHLSHPRMSVPQKFKDIKKPELINMGIAKEDGNDQLKITEYGMKVARKLKKTEN